MNCLNGNEFNKEIDLREESEMEICAKLYWEDYINNNPISDWVPIRPDIILDKEKWLGWVAWLDEYDEEMFDIFTSNFHALFFFKIRKEWVAMFPEHAIPYLRLPNEDYLYKNCMGRNPHDIENESKKMWEKSVKKNRIPYYIPKNPDKVYKHIWLGWTFWLSTY